MKRAIFAAALAVVFETFGANAWMQQARKSPEWFTRGVMYQIQPRAFTPEGTLAAAKAKLPYLKDLGVTIAYLVPVMKMDADMDQGFWSPRQIRSGFNNPKNQYRIADYFHVDEEYGTDQDLKDFCAEAHRLGMKVVFDLVYLHCGPTAPFLKEHPEFTWWNPDGTVKKGPWRFPKLNFAVPGLRAYFMDNIKSLIRDFGADGFRCDVGDGIPLDFWCDAHDMMDDLTGGNAVLLCEGFTVCDQYKGFDADYGWFPGMSAKAVRGGWTGRERQCPVGSRFVNHYENHDIATDARPRREKAWGHDAIDQVLVWMFTLDGVPLLFTGNEIADADERHSMFGKTPMDWSQLAREPGKSRHAFVKRLAALRREHPAFTDVNGSDGLTWLDTTAEDAVTAFVRRNGRETILVVQNWTRKPVKCTVSFAVSKRATASYLAPDETDRDVKGTIAAEPLFVRDASYSPDGGFTIGPLGWWISKVDAPAACAFPAARGVLARFAGEAVAERFAFARMEAAEPQAEIAARDGKILIRATDENRAAAAVGRYIREVAKGHWSRSGNRVPTVWPLPEKPIKVKTVLPHLHAYNYCLFSYSFAFYGEEEWRANIDRLALSGFTSALVPTGNMKVWQLFLRDAGFSEAQISSFIPDETAQSWVNCGVMEGVGAPFPPERIDEEARLGRWIVKEMRALGIEPMLQGFTGLLPNSATNVLAGAKWPDAKLYDQGRWAGGLKRPILLDATTDAYARLAKMWYRRLYEVYGISDPRYFVGNLFSEGGIAKGVDCRKIAAAMQRGQQAASPGATWCISCWGAAPRQDLLEGLNPDLTRIIVLDRNMANGGRFPRGFGKITWIWGELLNFGGNEGMYGGMDALKNLGGHLRGPNGATLRGYALESEGLDSNPVFYDLFTDLFFRPDAVSGKGMLDRWLAGYAERRYGVKDARLEAALSKLASSVWNVNRMQEGCSETVFCARPKWDVKKSSSWATREKMYYDPKDVEAAARLYLSVAQERPELLKLETFRFDFTDVFRQVLSNRGVALAPRLKDDPSARAAFLALIRQQDALLACTDAFRLDTYEARARKRAGTRGIRALRRMYTTWIERPRSNLNDYAHHQFAGLLSNYYAKRWEAFFADPDHADAALDALEASAPSSAWTMPPRGGDLLNLASAAFGEITIRSDYPGGNVKVVGIDEAKGVVRVAPDLRDTQGKWFHWDFTVCGAAGRKIHFSFPNGYEYLSSLGPAISKDKGKTWTWLRSDGTRHEPANAFDYTFGPNENETRFAVSIPYSQKDWDAFMAKWRGKGVVCDVLCKSQSGMRDTELVHIPCRKTAKWLFAFTARHHACETSANAPMEGVVEAILSGTPEGEWLRDNADCVFVPFMDKDGVENGDQGKNRRPYDHNRDYLKGRYTSVRALKELLVKESEGKQIVFIDMHSPHVRSLPSCPEQDHVFTFGCRDERLNAHWNAFRRNWKETQKGGALVYDGKYDIFAGKGYAVTMEKQWAAGFMSADPWVRTLPNCYLATCCEFGYSLCGGVYSFPAARELGRNMLKALVRTAQAPEKP